METKYNVDISQEILNKEITRLINQLWKIIPMRENEEDWKRQLNTVIIETTGLNEIIFAKAQGIQLLSKMEGMLLLEDMPFVLYRKTVFECISLFQEIKNDNK